MTYRINTFTAEGRALHLFVSDCTCGVVFGIPKELEQRRREDGKSFYCPNGHSLVFSDRVDTKEKLRQAEAREVALQDQLSAALRDAETTRAALLRDRARFAAGVCPCCNRSFDNVRRHMRSQHPDYDVTRLDRHGLIFKCSCGKRFESYRGLRTHQGHQRRTSGRLRWDAPDQDRWYAHLTEIGAR